MAAARGMPAVCGVLESNSPARTMRMPCVFQSGPMERLLRELLAHAWDARLEKAAGLEAEAGEVQLVGRAFRTSGASLADAVADGGHGAHPFLQVGAFRDGPVAGNHGIEIVGRSEERRVGKEC